MKIALWVAGIALALFLGIGIYRAGFYPTLTPHENGQLRFGPGTLYGRRLQSASWQASYDSISASSDQTVLDLDGVHDGIVDRDGKPYLNVSAKHLTVNVQTHDFSGNGGIRVTSLQRDTPLRSFDCEQIAWSNALQTLTVIGRVRLHSGAAEALEVDGLSYDVKTGDLKLGAIAGAANFVRGDETATETPEIPEPRATTEIPVPRTIAAATPAAASVRTGAYAFANAELAVRALVALGTHVPPHAATSSARGRKARDDYFFLLDSAAP